jgi:F-type H+-transporting ATPase subunit epsilon
VSSFSVHLLAADRYERIDGAVSFVGEDKSGSFGLLARHERFMTVLDFGLARITLADGSLQYLGFPGGLAYFIGNELRTSTRRYLRDTDVERIIFIGQTSLRRAIAEYVAHFHEERNHQGLENRLIRGNLTIAAKDALIHRRTRLGGMLNYYHRVAA